MRYFTGLLGLLLLVATGLPRDNADTVRILTLGDSITKGVRPGVKAEETFAARIEQQLRQQGLRVNVTNAGVGGETTVGAGKRLGKEVLAKSPHLVLIMYGTNDCYVDKGKTESRVSVGDFKTNLTNLVNQLQNAGIKVVLMTEPAYAENGPKNGIGEDSNLRLGQYMAVVRELAKAKQLPLVDHFADWSAQRAKGIKLQPLTTDGYHPSPRGHEEMADRIVPVILPLVKKVAEKP